ncbi:sigma-70 family RNA polymerase sigma factor [Microvirga massiliensis]|uniref:sigma-70 family RNA polymerase sigma factor n=1 Tax=Microvirga massiliensis TaxID=1033741 RepID=UPI0009E477F8|nr:sigma-70 family RNA polymerase sigma factor [Microvirga massiliensis]
MTSGSAPKEQAHKPATFSRSELLGALPHLRAFAISLTGNVDAADDLVQDTLVRALSKDHLFTPGTCLQAWLFTILRNLFHTHHRRCRREMEDPDGNHARRLSVMPNQVGVIEFGELREALAQLPAEQREALLLVTAEDFSYEEAARITGAQIGTIKSRVNRARNRLAEIMQLDDLDEIGPDRVVRAILYSPHTGR